MGQRREPKNTMAFSEWTCWLGALRNNPRNMGAVMPSSLRLARAVAQAALKESRSSLILEVGAGTGRITDHLVQHDRQDLSLHLVEICPRLGSYLNQKFPHLPLTIGAFQDAWPQIFGKHDVTIVSSVPLFSLNPETRQDYLASLARAIRTGQVRRCIQYTYWPRLPWPEARGIFGESSRLVPGNLPPAWVWWKDFDLVGEVQSPGALTGK
jgi:phospholipid N-methyltransferase